MTLELKIIDRWMASPASQPAEEIASLSHETRRIPDPYLFLIKGKKLISPSNDVPVEKIVRQKGEIEEREFRALLKIQRWAGRADSGTVLWFSPPSEGTYPELKIVVSEILHHRNRGKILFNRAFVLPFDSEETLKLANRFSSQAVADVESLREDPLFLTPKESLNWINILGSVTDQTEYLRGSRDLIIKDETLFKAGQVKSLDQARREGLIGQFPDSCGAFGYFLAHAETSFPCPRCGLDIPKGQGIVVCPHCGAKKEDYRKCD